jgi:hypothetical protein
VSTLAIQRFDTRSNRLNRATEYALPTLTAPPADRLRALFVAAYARIANACRAVDEPGLALVGVHESTGEPCAVVRIRQRIARYTVALVGRHERCDLYLDGEPALALRHLAVVVDPVRDLTRGASVRYRVLDLRTDCGFTDEVGRPMRGLSVDGVAILRCPGYLVFALPLGDPTDWPPDASDAWEMLPERVYLAEDDRLEVKRSMLRRSLLLPSPGPRDTMMQLAESSVAGLLEWIGMRRHRGSITVGEVALRDGILLGRYVRCDSSGMVDDPSLSRVHLLLLEIDGTLLAIDTASAHGIRLAHAPAERVIAIPDRAELWLGGSTRLAWRRWR